MSGMILDYEFPNTPLLCKAEEIELSKRIAEGDREARDRMIEANMPLVASIAKKMLRSDMLLEDLIQDGAIGLMRAVEKFDHTKGYKFSTYGAWWIRQAIGRSIMEYRAIRLPCYIQDQLTLLRKESTRLEMQFGREATERDLALATGFTQEHIHELQEIPHTFSLNKPMRDQDPYANVEPESYEVFLKDPCDLENEYIESMQDERVLLYQAINTLPGHYADILRRRYGVGGREPETLDTIAASYHLTRERIRQLEVKAMKKLLAALSEQGVAV